MHHLPFRGNLIPFAPVRTRSSIPAGFTYSQTLQIYHRPSKHPIIVGGRSIAWRRGIFQKPQGYSTTMLLPQTTPSLDKHSIFSHPYLQSQVSQQFSIAITIPPSSMTIQKGQLKSKSATPFDRISPHRSHPAHMTMHPISEYHATRGLRRLFLSFIWWFGISSSLLASLRSPDFLADDEDKREHKGGKEEWQAYLRHSQIHASICSILIYSRTSKSRRSK